MILSGHNSKAMALLFNKPVCCRVECNSFLGDVFIVPWSVEWEVMNNTEHLFMLCWQKCVLKLMETASLPWLYLLWVSTCLNFSTSASCTYLCFPAIPLSVFVPLVVLFLILLHIHT